ncbi:hypothetical protein ACFOU0_13820 [Salinicoccus sesuvii]|uniref:Uncharacterized protein n=1 Tax=Salinicoccus sesuvii TaxID=868281 RepID=A0ABV7NAB5_9STAP
MTLPGYFERGLDDIRSIHPVSSRPLTALRGFDYFSTCSKA